MKTYALLLGLVAAASSCAATPAVSVPILVYHRISEGKPGNTTVTPEHFRDQLETLEKRGYHIIPLADVVAWKAGLGVPPKANSIVITFDDGHASFFENAKPVIDQFHIPVTQFLVAQCISHGTYCVTWDEVATLVHDPYIDLESHTWNHPDFAREVRRRNTASYRKFVDFQLTASKKILERRMNRAVPMLAWPYGLYSPLLAERATADGYLVGFSVECRAVTDSDPLMAIPRCMVLNSDLGPGLLRLVNRASEAANTTTMNRKWRSVPVVSLTAGSK